tara:strand:+ start:313 stop:525 length:213 start_codon:yes stop_codon:yes gene_type:complete
MGKYQPLQDGLHVIVYTPSSSFKGIVLESIGDVYKIKLDNGKVDWYLRFQIDPDKETLWAPKSPKGGANV